MKNLTASGTWRDKNLLLSVNGEEHRFLFLEDSAPSEINEEVDDIKIVQFPAEQEDEDDDDEAEDLDAYTQSGMLDDVSR